MPSQFARQFGYDQLYVGNPNSGLRFSDNLYEEGGRGTFSWLEEHVRGSICHKRYPILLPVLVSAHGMLSRTQCPDIT